MKKDRSRRFVYTKHVDESGAWYTLDNAGIIMPAVTNETATGLFRLEFELNGPLDREILGKALSDTADRFSYFNVKLKRGFFWYYLAQCDTNPPVLEDVSSPNIGCNINSPNTRMFRILAKGDRIAGEFSHALTDGSGALCFMKSLVARYFQLMGIDPGAELGKGAYSDIFPAGSHPRPEEHEDGYQKYFPAGLPNPEMTPPAWQMPLKRHEKGGYRVITGILDVEDVLKQAKKRGVTLTEFLGAVYLDALQSMWFLEKPAPRKKIISVEIPVNLRRLFPIGTNRNFSLYILLTEDLRLGRRDFEELVQRAHYLMKREMDSRSIARQIARNAGSTRNIFVRAVPLFVKDFFARLLFVKLGEGTLSGFISNLGVVTMPPGFAPHIKTINFIPAPSLRTWTNASVASWNRQLIISFGSLAGGRDLERYFFTRLRRLGLAVSVRCRDGGE